MDGKKHSLNVLKQTIYTSPVVILQVYYALMVGINKHSIYICTILQCITDCVEGEVRLVGGDADSEGTIEVCTNSVWGLITDAGWDENDAHVVCRQLNLPVNGMYVYMYVCIYVCM